MRLTLLLKMQLMSPIDAINVDVPAIMRIGSWKIGEKSTMLRLRDANPVAVAAAVAVAVVRRSFDFNGILSGFLKIAL